MKTTSLPNTEPTRERVNDDTASIDLIGSTVRAGLSLLLGVGSTALVASMAGLMTPWLVTPVAGLASWALFRKIPKVAAPSQSWSVTIAALLIAVSFASLGLSKTHEHVLGGRDPGTYVATAWWIESTGSLWMDVDSPVFSGHGVTYDSPGFPSVGQEGSLRPQFLHVFPSTLALVASLFGSTAVFTIGPLIASLGLLAFFCFARSHISPAYALAGTALLAATMPFLYFGRSPFTEPMAMTFVFGGLWILGEAARKGSVRDATMAGLILGGVMLARIDGVVVLLALAAHIVLLSVKGSDDGGRLLAVLDRAWQVSAVMLLFAAVDGLIFSPPYLADHAEMIGAVLVLTLLLRVLSSRLRGAINTRRRFVANGLAIAIGGYLAYAALLRPHLEAPAGQGIYGISGLQEAAGVAVEPLRTYAEISMRWLGWYLGIPLLVVGCIAVIVTVRRSVLRPELSIATPALLGGGTLLLFVFRPSINPDQIWAMRRFVPIVIPVLIFLGIWLVEMVAAKTNWPGVFGAVFLLVFAVPIVSTTAEAGLQPELEHAAADVAQMCSVLEPGSSVLFVGEGALARQAAFGPALRGLCAVSVAAERPDSPVSGSAIADMRATALANSSTLWVSGGDGDALTLMDASYEYLEITLFEAPDSWQPFPVRLTASPG